MSTPNVTDWPRMDENAVVRRLQAATAGGLVEWSREHGVAHSIVSDVLRGLRRPTPQVLAALGLEKEAASYREKK